MQLEFRCKDLPSKDAFGDSDPFAIVYLKSEKETKWMRLGKTETIPDESCPVFKEIFTINY